MHGVIEFGNRLLTFVLVIIAIATFVFIWRMRPVRPDLRRLATIPIVGIVAQAVIGGLAVRSGLVWWVVGIHFVVSSALVGCTALLVERAYHGPGPRCRRVPRWIAVLARVTAAWAFVVVLLGIVATGSGPHAGDANTARSGFSVVDTYHVHALTAYILVALTVALLIGVTILRRDEPAVAPLMQAVFWLIGVEVLQVAIGVIQANTGVPAVLVNIHMVLAVLLVASATIVASRTRGSISRIADEDEPIVASAR